MRIPEILEYVRSKGYEVSDRQFRLWAEGIPLPEPTVIRGGRGHGNVKDYPPGTENMVVDLARWQAERVRTYDALAWLAWVKQYPVPPGRMREIFRAAYDRVIKTDVERLTPHDFTLAALVLICKIPEYKDLLMEVEEFVAEYIGGELAINGSNVERGVIIREHVRSPEQKEMDEKIDTAFYKSVDRDSPLVKMNFPKLTGFNMRLVLKLIFRFRVEYLVKNGLSGLAKLNVHQCIEEMPDNEIDSGQSYVQPVNVPIDDILNDPEILYPFDIRDPLFSLFVPTAWGVSRMPEFQEIIEWITTELEITDEPWFKKYPHKSSMKFINALRRSRGEITEVNNGYELLLRAIFSR